MLEEALGQHPLPWGIILIILISPTVAYSYFADWSSCLILLTGDDNQSMSAQN